MLRWMYDASTPPASPPPWHVAAGYIGGNPPHVWTEAEWDAQPAPVRLPIFTASNREDTAAAAVTDSGAIHAALEALGVPYGCTVAVDIETRVYGPYLEELDELLARQWPLMTYGSLSTIVHNPLTSGGRWAAHWTDLVATGIDLVGTDGIKAAQIANAGMLNRPWDWSLIDSSVPLWVK